MSNSIVGLDIGTNGLRAVEVENPDKRPVITRHAQVALPAGAVRIGEVADPHTVATAIKRLWSAGGFSTKDVVIGVGNQRVIARDYSVQRMPIQRIRESLPFQVQDLIPVPATEALLDFYPISEGTSEAGPVINGLLVAAVKEPVLANVNTVQLAGLNPVDVDLIPFAISRVLATSPASGVQALVDVGASTTCVVVTVGRVPHFVRIIPTGGEDVTRAISSRLGVSLDEAENFKRRTPVVGAQLSPVDREIADAIAQQSNDLLGAVHNTLTYFANLRGDVAIERLVLSGGGARLNGFAQSLAEVTGKSASWADPFSSMTLSRSVKKSVDAGRLSLTVALGLALGGRE